MKTTYQEKRIDKADGTYVIYRRAIRGNKAGKWSVVYSSQSGY